MRKIKTILFLDNSSTAKFLLKKTLENSSFNLISIVLSGEQKFGKKIKIKKVKKFVLDKKNFFSINKLLKKEKPQIGFSYFNHKIPKNIYLSFEKGIINFHPSYLPYNKGRHSAFWSIYDDTPMGASAHWINEKFDCGDIFTQKKLNLNKFCSAFQVYNAQIKLLNSVILNTINSVSKLIFFKKRQKKIKNSYHFKDDIIKKITFSLQKKISNEEFIKVIRGTKFKNNGIFILKNKKTFKIISTYSFKKNNKIKITRERFKKQYLFKDIFGNLDKKKYNYKIFLDKYTFYVKSLISKV